MGDSAVESTSSSETVPTEAAAPAETCQSPIDELSCTICLSTRFTKECRVDGCSHAFCFSCISEWVCQSIRPSCPMCRKDVDKIFYDFEKNLKGRMEINVLEYRSANMNLSSSEKTLMLSERRLVVRNMMHAHKIMESIGTAIKEQAQESEELKASLNELLAAVTQHVEKSEVLLGKLRTDSVRRNKILVFSNPTFRKMLYTIQIRVKYAEYKKNRDKPDLSKDPERFRKIVNDFLMSEFDVIPLHVQPTSCGISWRTKFLGPSVTAEEKTRLATDIYDLMLTKPTGTEVFQTDLLNLFPQIGNSNAQLLDDHLDAIVLTDKTNLREFYNVVYYDTVYNSSSNSFMDFGVINNMREERTDRLEIIFQHIHRDFHRDIMGPDHWNEFVGGERFRRQTSNTNGTDRATIHDDSSRSPSPEERVATPMPDEDGGDFAVSYFDRVMEPQLVAARARVERELRRLTERERALQQERMNRYDNRAEREQQLVDMYMDTEAVTTSRTRPFLEAQHAARQQTINEDVNRTQEQRLRSLRPSARREQALQATRADSRADSRADTRQAERPATRRENLNYRVRVLESRSNGITNLLRNYRNQRGPAPANGLPFDFQRPFYRELPPPPTPPPVYNPVGRPVYRMVAPSSRESPFPPFGASYAESMLPNQPYATFRVPVFLNGRQMLASTSGSASTASGLPAATGVARPEPLPTNSRSTGSVTWPTPSAPVRETAHNPPARPATPDPDLDELVQSIYREDEERGLDFVSVAHRTRSARRAAASGTLPGTPAAKRTRGNQ